MTTRTKAIVAGGAAALLLAGTGAASAASTAKNPTRASAEASAKAGKHRRHGAIRLVVKASADYIGIAPKDVVAGLKSGQSLAQIATAHGKSVDGLKQAIYNAFKARLDKAVAAGKIDAAKEQKILDRLNARLDELVNRTFDKHK